MVPGLRGVGFGQMIGTASVFGLRTHKFNQMYWFLFQVVSYYCVLIALSLHYLGSSCQACDYYQSLSWCTLSGGSTMDCLSLGAGRGWQVWILVCFFLNYVCVPQAVCSGGRQQQCRRHKPDDHQFRGAIFQERCSQGGHGPEQGLGCSGPPAGSLSCWLLGPPLSHHVEGGGEQWQGLISGPPNRNRIIALHRLPTSPPYSPTWFWSPCSSVVSRCLAPSRASCSTSHQSGPSSSTSRSEKEILKFDCS